MKHKHTSKLVLAVAFLLFSCSEVERDNPYDKGGTNYGGSSDSAQTVIIHGTPVNYEDETYETVVIGTQTWLARNLNYASVGSRCYDDNPDKCATYGRLYDWATMMALPSSCNSSSCSSQISARHKGICPNGWHIPSDAEWTTLIGYAGGGTKLKASSGWEQRYGNGTDNYGFVALPGGFCYSDGTFKHIGYYGYWWSISEYSTYDAYYRFVSFDSESMPYNYDYKGSLRSVRCLQD